MSNVFFKWLWLVFYHFEILNASYGERQKWRSSQRLEATTPSYEQYTRHPIWLPPILPLSGVSGLSSALESLIWNWTFEISWMDSFDSERYGCDPVWLPSILPLSGFSSALESLMWNWTSEISWMDSLTWNVSGFCLFRVRTRVLCTSTVNNNDYLAGYKAYINSLRVIAESA